MRLAGDTAIAIEQERDRLVRAYAGCRCGAGVDERCDYGEARGATRRAWAHTSHEYRYNRAAQAGVVPRLPGSR